MYEQSGQQFAKKISNNLTTSLDDNVQIMIILWCCTKNIIFCELCSFSPLGFINLIKVTCLKLFPEAWVFVKSVYQQSKGGWITLSLLRLKFRNLCETPGQFFFSCISLNKFTKWLVILFPYILRCGQMICHFNWDESALYFIILFDSTYVSVLEIIQNASGLLQPIQSSENSLPQ